MPYYENQSKYQKQILQNLLKAGYYAKGENSINDIFNRVSSAYASNDDHKNRLLQYLKNGWFLPATPVLANGGTGQNLLDVKFKPYKEGEKRVYLNRKPGQGLPISCFLLESEDTLDSINETHLEARNLTSLGGGIGVNYANLRENGSTIREDGKTSGIIPFLVADSYGVDAIAQSKTRRGAVASYLHISHPEVEEFLYIRSKGGELKRKVTGMASAHHGIVLSDEFMNAVKNDEKWYFTSPKTKEKTSFGQPARELWEEILTLRMETGEPYIVFEDNVKKYIPESYKKLGLEVKMSNLCVTPETEIITKEYGNIAISEVAGQEVTVWNGFEWSKVTPQKTGENQEIWKVTCYDHVDEKKLTLLCTKEHHWYINSDYENPVQTNFLPIGGDIAPYTLPNKECEILVDNIEIQSVEKTNRISDTYCLKEPKRGTVVFNGILTGNCSEIMLHTGIDHLGRNRTAVCCLSSLNLYTYDEWKGNTQFIKDVMLFLDNVLQDFIDRAPDTVSRAKYSAIRERSIGLGVMGLQSYFQKHLISFESDEAKNINLEIFKWLKSTVDTLNEELAEELGANLDCEELGIKKRFSHVLAVAPTATIGKIAGQVSPGIEPAYGSVFMNTDKMGTVAVATIAFDEVLKTKNVDNMEELLHDIVMSDGDLRKVNLKYGYIFTKEEIEAFKPWRLVDQMKVIEMAGDRTPYICQSQSLNIFAKPDIEKKEFHKLHWQAWRLGIKSLYYCRSYSIGEGQEECIACQ